MEFLYDKFNDDYSFLQKIMGDYYGGKLKYEDLLPALERFRNKILETRDYCKNNEFFYERVGRVLKFLEDIMSDLYKNRLNIEDVIPALGELSIKLLHTQKCFVEGNKFLESKIDNKEEVLINALESTKNKAR